MKTTEEILSKLSEVELAYVSAEYYSQIASRLDKASLNLPTTQWSELLTFQNGWLACKEFYSYE